MKMTKRNQKNKSGFTQPFWVKPLLRRAGFTLGEMITTVAIIGTIAAIAIPNYLRIKMNANEEMVRQQMRIVAEKMSEIIGRTNQYPPQGSWPDNLNPSDPDEMGLMGNLSAIDDMCYTNTDYSVNEPRSTYRFCVQPKPDACGKWAGTKRFCVHSNVEMSTLFATGVVGEVSKWEGAGKETYFWMPAIAQYDALDGFSRFFSSLNPSSIESSDVNLVANQLEKTAYWSDMMRNMTLSGCQSNPEYSCDVGPLVKTPSTFLIFSESGMPVYNAMLPEIYSHLAAKGIYITQIERDANYAVSHSNLNPTLVTQTLENNPDPKVFEISFTLNEPVETYDEAMTRIDAISGVDVEDWYWANQ